MTNQTISSTKGILHVNGQNQASTLTPKLGAADACRTPAEATRKIKSVVTAVVETHGAVAVKLKDLGNSIVKK